MLTPEKFPETPVYDLLTAAAQGRIGMDLRWARSILDRGEAAVADMVRFGVEDRSAHHVILDDQLLVMFRQLRSPASIPFFVDYLRKNPFEASEELADAIRPLRAEAFEPLIKLYGELEEDESSEVAFLLASFRIRDDRVLRLLLDRLEFDLLDGALCLSLYGDSAAREPLQKMLDESDDEYVKIELQHTLDDLDRAPDENVEEPFDIAEYFPETAGPEVSVLDEQELLELFESSDVEYRLAAASGFVNRDLEPATLAGLLDRGRTDPEPRVRAACWEALASQAADNDEVYRAMLERLEDESVPMVERAGALAGLGQKADEEPIRKYAEQFYENPETRAAALSAMWNSLDRTFAKYFPTHLDDPDLEIRKHAISGVGYLGIYEAAEHLRQYFDHEELRANALFAYALSARSEISPARVRALFRRIEEFAGGFSEEEEELVKIALDERLMLHGHKPVFHADEHRHHEHGPDCDHDHEHDHEPVPAPVAAPVKAGRNDPCPCGSGKKYKKCCGA